VELWEEWMGLVLAFWGWEKSSKCQMPRPTEDSHSHGYLRACFWYRVHHAIDHFSLVWLVWCV
jgi:hypothetical protein